MKRTGIASISMLLICIFFLAPSTACSVRGPGFGVHVGDEPAPVVVGPPPPPYPPGPPPHAPAHGYRAKYTYYYYPEPYVYFDVSRQLYFYMDDGAWRVSVSLPSHIHVQLGDHVTIGMDSDRPYTKFKHHKKKYPPGKKKKKKHWKHR